MIFFLPLAAKNEADRQAEKREIKRRLTRKVLLAPVVTATWQGWWHGDSEHVVGCGQVTGLLCKCPQCPRTAVTLECGLSPTVSPWHQGRVCQ